MRMSLHATACHSVGVANQTCAIVDRPCCAICMRLPVDKRFADDAVDITLIRMKMMNE